MMKRLVSVLVCAVLVALLAADFAQAATVAVQNTQGVGARIYWAAGTANQQGVTGPLYKSGARNASLPNATALNPSGGDATKIWLQFDLASVWATYGKANLQSATITLWGENGNARRFELSGMNNGLTDYDDDENLYSLESWTTNTLSWFNAPANQTNSGYLFDPAKTSVQFQNNAGAAIGTDIIIPTGHFLYGDAEYNQCSRYVSGDIAAYLGTDSDGKVTFMLSDGPSNSNQNWWVGPGGSYDVGSNYQVNGVVVRDSPTLTLTFADVPEPATLAILGLGGLFLRRRLA